MVQAKGESVGAQCDICQVATRTGEEKQAELPKNRRNSPALIDHHPAQQAQSSKYSELVMTSLLPRVPKQTLSPS